MVKDHSDSEKGNPLPPHRLLLSINSKGSFICTIPLFNDTPAHVFIGYWVYGILNSCIYKAHMVKAFKL